MTTATTEQSTETADPGTDTPSGAEMPSPNELVAQCCQKAMACIEDRPVTSVLATFGAGLGLGIAAAALLTKSDQARTGFTSGIGRAIVDSLSRAIPESLQGK